MILNPPYHPRPDGLLSNGDPVSPLSSGTTTLVPLGGCGEFGRNMTALVCEGELFIIDCGILFSQEPYLGLSGIFFDITPWVERYGAPKAYIITHAHRDHVGALMYFLPFWPAEIYGTPWTIACIEGDLQKQQKPEYGSLLRTVDEGQRFTLGAVSFEYIAVNHSIPESCSLYIQTPYHHIAHSGDFKIDPHSSLEPPADLARWQQIVAQNPIDVFLCDSTNAHISGSSLSEDHARESLIELFQKLSGRIFVSTFASNLWRLIHIIEAAEASSRKVHVLGFGMNKTLELGKNLGFYDPSSACYQERSKRAKKFSYEDIEKSRQRGDVFLVSGSQMEPRSVLARIIAGKYGSLNIEPGDTVVFSSRTIPGYERALIRAQGLIMWKGAQVITTDLNRGIHVSGHAYSEDINVMLSLLRPRYFIPIHGELTHLMHNALARSSQDTFLWRNEQGCVLHGSDIHPYSLEESLEEVYVDQNDVLLEPASVQQRREVAMGGVVVVSGVYATPQGGFVQGPYYDSMGTPWNVEWFLSHRITELLEGWVREYDQRQGGVFGGFERQKKRSRKRQQRADVADSKSSRDLGEVLSYRLYHHLSQVSGGARAKVIVHLWRDS